MISRPQTFLGRLLVWRVRHVSNKNFILLLSVVLGIFGGITAIFLKVFIHYFQQFLTSGFSKEYLNVMYIFYPMIGIFLTVLLIRIFYRGEFAHGITNVLYAISKKSSIVKLRDTLYFLMGSLFTVGMGGSVGLEATLVMSGSGFGSNLARMLRLSYRSRMLLLGCGTAGALSAFFNAPIAGVIFALEVLMLDLTMASLIPLVMASVVGFIMSRIFLGEEIMFNFSLHDSFSVSDIPFFVALGVLAGLVSLYFTRIDRFVGGMFRKFRNPFVKPLTGAVILGLMIFMFPPLYGEGYEAIKVLLSDQPSNLMNNSVFYDFKDATYVLLLFIAAIILVKAFAVSITLSSGGIGGFFAPSLFLGGLCGFFFAYGINLIDLPVRLSENNFMLVGMAGAFSGIFHAPLSAIFLIAELTRGYELMVPLMLVSTISYLIIIYFEPHSLFTRRLAQKGELVTHHKDRAVLTLLKLHSVIEKDLKKVYPEMPLGDFLKNAVAHSRRNIFPVVDENNKFLGVVLLDDIREIMFKPEMYDGVMIRDLMHLPPAYVYGDEAMDRVLKKFDETGAWNLPVIDHDDNYIGFISKSKVLTAYRRLLVQFSEE